MRGTEAFRLVLLGSVLQFIHSFTFHVRMYGRHRSCPTTTKFTRESRTDVKMTTDSTPWSHTDSEQSSIWLEDGNRIEYLDDTGGSKGFSSLADAIGLNISSDVSERSIIPHHLTSSSDLFCNREINMEQLAQSCPNLPCNLDDKASPLLLVCSPTT